MPPPTEPMRGELDSIWKELKEMRTMIGTLRENEARADEGRIHLKQSIDQLTGKVDALITSMATANGGLRVGRVLLAAIGSVFMLFLGWGAGYVRLHIP